MNTVSPLGEASDTSERLDAGSRPARILALVRSSGLQSIEALALEFGVTSQTIRRDVNRLCERGLCRRMHGGIAPPPATENVDYAHRQRLNHDAKRRIAQRVADFVPDHSSLFVGIGTTPEQCALALAHKHNLRVMTNNLHAALALSRNASCELTIAGGRLRNLDHDVIAGEAHGFFARFSVDIGIYGVGGVADDGCLLDFNQDEVRMRCELARHCRRRFIVLDHSKFGRGATVRGGHLTEASVVFTDQALPPHLQSLLDAAGVQAIVAGAAPSSPLS
jgi:DeoR family transcriptional regulator, glycerol-3-phosphate regulon repressor